MALFPKVGRQQIHIRLAWWTVVTFLCLGVFLHLLPFYYMITSSLKSGLETIADPPTLWPQHITLVAWKLVFSIAMNGSTSTIMAYPFYVYFLNSLFITGMTLLLSLPITSLAAYANSKLQRGPLARWTFLYAIGTLMVPYAVLILPSMLLTLNFPFALPEGSIPNLPGTSTPFPTMSIFDTPWAVIIPGLFNAFNFLLFKGFFDTLPNSILQAARVDGGSEFNIFRRIVLPMSIPVYAVAGWLQFSATWDSYLWPSLVFRSPEKLTTAIAINNIIMKMSQAGSISAEQSTGQTMQMREIFNAGLTWNGLMVFAILQTIPIFLMFILCREYLLKGIRVRGLR